MAQGRDHLEGVRRKFPWYWVGHTSFMLFSTVKHFTDWAVRRVDEKTSQKARARTKARERALKMATESANGYSWNAWSTWLINWGWETGGGPEESHEGEQGTEGWPEDSRCKTGRVRALWGESCRVETGRGGQERRLEGCRAAVGLSGHSSGIKDVE